MEEKNKSVKINKDNDKKFRNWDNDDSNENINESTESNEEIIEYFTE